MGLFSFFKLNLTSTFKILSKQYILCLLLLLSSLPFAEMVVGSSDVGPGLHVSVWL